MNMYERFKDDSTKRINYSVLLEEYVGSFGKYQIVTVLLLAVYGLPSAVLNVGIVLFAFSPHHHCTVPYDYQQLAVNENVTDEKLETLFIPLEGDHKSHCRIRQFPQDRNYSIRELQSLLNNSDSRINETACDSWSFDQSYFSRTIVTQMKLVCGREVIVATMQSVFYGGFMAGLSIFGFVSDRFGRRRALLISTVLMLISGIGEAFCPDPLTFILVRFVVAFSCIGAYTTAFIMSVENVGEKHRPHCGMIINLSWALGYVLLPLVGLTIRDWFTLYLVTVLPFVGLLSYFWLLDESARWLYACGRSNEADLVVLKMARQNNTINCLPKNFIVENTNYGDESLWEQFVQVSKLPRLRRRTISMYFLWFVVSMVYYGLSLSSSDLQGSPHVNFMLLGAIEIPGYLLCQFACAYWGRRNISAVCYAVAGVCLASVAIMQLLDSELGWLVTGLVLVGKLATTTAFGAVYVWAAELFPTILRNVGLSSCSFMARVGGILAPYIGLLKSVNVAIPQSLFAITSLLAAAVCFILPETRSRQLPETLAQAEMFETDDQCSTDVRFEPTAEWTIQEQTAPNMFNDSAVESTYF